MKKAFTIAEAIISAAMLGVLAVVLFPMLQDFQPNKDKTSYNKALYSMQSAVSNVMEDSYSIAANRLLESDSSLHWKDEEFLKNLTEQQFCEALAENFNTSGEVNCSGVTNYSNPNFTTADGIKFWGITTSNSDTKFANSGSQLIYMDRNLKKADLNKRKKEFATLKQEWNNDTAYGLKLIVRYDGKVHTDKLHPQWTYENKLIEKSMSMNLKDEKTTTQTK